MDRARVDKNAEGQVVRLTEGVWTIDYNGWDPIAGGGHGYSIPKAMTIVRDGSPMRLELTLLEAAGFDSGNLPHGYQPIKMM